MGICQSITTNQNQNPVSPKKKTIRSSKSEHFQRKVSQSPKLSFGRLDNQKTLNPLYSPTKKKSIAFCPTFKEIHCSPKKSKKFSLFDFNNIEETLNLDLSIYPEESPKLKFDNFKILKESENKKIYRVRNQLTGRDVKMVQFEIKLSENYFKEEMNNIDIMKKLNHPHIIKYLGTSTSQNKVYYTVEYSNEGFLSTRINEFNEYTAGIVIYQILLAIQYLNSNKIMHRNIKLENILISDFFIDDRLFFVKLTDFRKAKQFEKNVNELDFIGSGIYVAPEVISSAYNEKCDIWTVGVIFFMLITGGKPPFQGETLEQTLEKIQIEPLQFPKNFNTELKKFITLFLEKDPLNRISVIDALENSWFKKYRIAEKFVNSERRISGTLEKMNCLLFYMKPKPFNLICEWVNICKDSFKVEAVFNFLDKDKDGKITKEDIKEAYLKENSTKNKELTNLENIFNKHFELTGHKKMRFYDFFCYCIDKATFVENVDTLYHYIKFHSGLVNGVELDKCFIKDGETGRVDKVFLELKKNIHVNLDLDDFKMLISKISE